MSSTRRLSAIEFLQQDAASQQTHQVNHNSIMEEKQVDIEAGKEPVVSTEERQRSLVEEVRYGSVSEVARTKEIQQRASIFRSMRKGEEWLDSKMGIELQGIDRVPEEERKPPSIWNIFFLWFSLNMHVGTVPLGVLGAEFGLNLHQIVGAGIIGNCLGALCTAFTGTMSPKLGLRQIAVSRYSFGFWGAKLCSILNVIVGGGFFVVNLVVVGQMLSAVSNYTMTITVGIVIVAIVSYLVSVFGFAIIHTYEKYSWIATFILLLVLVGQVAPHVVPSAPAEDTGLALSGAYLTMISLTFSNASGWCSIAGDYYVHFPLSTPKWKVFVLTYFGVLIPVTFAVVVGALLGNVAVTAAVPPFADVYEEHLFGGLLLNVFHPIGWSKFALVILTFSVLGNNIAINYSSGLSIQLLGHYFHAVPRLIWSLLFAIVVAVLAIAGQEHLSTIVSNFVSLLGYWTVSFTVILLLEDQWFRRSEGYDLLVWDSPKALPAGAAAVFALLSGYLAGGLPGMAQTWYVGPIAKKFSHSGGDVGVYMSFVITLVVFFVGRTVERRIVGR